MNTLKILSLVTRLSILIGLIGVVPVSAARQEIPAAQSITSPEAKFSQAVAFDMSAPLRQLSAQRISPQEARRQNHAEPVEIRGDRGPQVPDQGFGGDGASRQPLSGCSRVYPA